MDFIGLIPPEVFGLFDGRAEALLQAPLAWCHGEYALGDVLDDLRQRKAFAVGEVRDGALVSLVVLRVVEYPRLRSLLVFSGAGKNTFRLSPFIRDFARRQGCARIEARCRKSVGKLFARNGFRVGECVPLLFLED
jgi:hypothetical protein